MRVVFAVLLCAAAFAPARAAPPAVDLEDAADHHVAAQGDYEKGLQGSWEWELGSGRSAPNITGIAAQGLLAAHRLTGLKEHEDSALRAARSLIAALDRGWSKRRPFTQDVEFLAATGFVIDAAKWFRVITHHWKPDRYVDYVIERRAVGDTASFAGWDIASAIRSALAVGEVSYARGMLRHLIARRASWDRDDRAQARTLSAASLLWAVAQLKQRSVLDDEQQRFVEDLLARVKARQHASGGWLTPDGKWLSTQVTAYSVLGLSHWPSASASAKRGRNWLQKVARPDRRVYLGGRIWASEYSLDGRPSGAFVSEVQSEAMQALASGS